MATKNKFIFEDMDDISKFLAKKWKHISKETIKKRGIFTVALSGGKTPQKLYQNLSKIGHNFAWDKTHIFLVDERYGPSDNSSSNLRMIKENLLKNVDIPKKNIHRIYTEKTLEKSSRLYEKDMMKFFNLKNNKLPRFDLILLGIGEDGHTASLFPNANFQHKENSLVLVTHHKKTNNYRITLTLPVLNNASHIIFIVTGKKKRNILQKIFEKGSILPAALIKPKKGNLCFLLDKASGLGPSRK